MARFIIADITEPRSIPQELYAIIPHLPSVPVQPLLQSGIIEYGMFSDFRDYRWVLEPVRYDNTEHAIALLRNNIIGLAEQKIRELRP